MKLRQVMKDGMGVELTERSQPKCHSAERLWWSHVKKTFCYQDLYLCSVEEISSSEEE